MAYGCCGFAALRCILVFLNTVYIGLSLFLVGLVIAARTLAYNYTNIPVLIAIGIVAAFLFIVAVLGLIGTLRHNMIIMFFYMILLGLSGVALFAVSVAALSVPRDFQDTIFEKTWTSLSLKRKSYIQEQLNCCGFSDKKEFRWALDPGNTTGCLSGHPTCVEQKCCENKNESVPMYNQGGCIVTVDYHVCPECNSCYTKWRNSVSSGLKLAGGLGLIFSLTQVAGIVLTFRFRNLKDPSANPGDYL